MSTFRQRVAGRATMRGESSTLSGPAASTTATAAANNYHLQHPPHYHHHHIALNIIATDDDDDTTFENSSSSEIGGGLLSILLRGKNQQGLFKKEQSSLHQTQQKQRCATIGLRRRKSIILLFVLLVSIAVAQQGYFQLRKAQNERIQQGIVKLFHHRSVVVSIGTVPHRCIYLLRTLNSLFHQTVQPTKAQVHYSTTKYYDDYGIGGNHTDTTNSTTQDVLADDESYPGLQHVMHDAEKLLRDARGCRTELSFHPADPNWRSATKLLGFLHQEWGGTKDGNVRSSDSGGGSKEESLVIVADDDFEYLPTWLESLLAGHLTFQHSAVALRGWRVRKDLKYGAPPVGRHSHPDGVWGSFPAVERYVIRGANIREPYRVGVVTGVNGILLRPSFFGPEIFHAPTTDHFAVDDIWYSGNLANRSIERWVVPFRGSGNNDRDVGFHLGQSQTVIDEKLKVESRARANHMVLQYFAESWKKGDGDHLWWSEGTSPKLRGLLPFRHWFSERIILGLHSIHWIHSFLGDWRV